MAKEKEEKKASGIKISMRVWRSFKQHYGSHAKLSPYLEQLMSDDLDRKTPRTLAADVLTQLALRLCGEGVAERVGALLTAVDQRDLLKAMLEDIAAAGEIYRSKKFGTFFRPADVQVNEDASNRAPSARELQTALEIIARHNQALRERRKAPETG